MQIEEEMEGKGERKRVLTSKPVQNQRQRRMIMDSTGKGFWFQWQIKETIKSYSTIGSHPAKKEVDSNK